MKRIPARQAVRNMRALGETAQWSFGGAQADALGYEQATGAMAANRVFQDFWPNLRPKFSLSDNPSIFASGSCFAREIEMCLNRAGRNVLSWNPSCGLEPVSFNRYNTFSVNNDFHFAVVGEYDENLIWSTPIGWIDYSGNGVYSSRDELIAARNSSIDIHKRIADADVFILTLGLVEAWFDIQTNTYLNFTPSEVLAANLGRFECRITSYEENVLAVRNMLSFIRDEINPGLKVILTVSPVPLNVTFSGQDIAVANTLSKSTLRAVAQNIADSDELVDYFPSYEMVTLSDPQSAWYPDYRHVRPEMVGRIMSHFTNHYVM